jgi:hypothetical protein
MIVDPAADNIKASITSSELPAENVSFSDWPLKPPLIFTLSPLMLSGLAYMLFQWSV